jgi:hypothetical protein
VRLEDSLLHQLDQGAKEPGTSGQPRAPVIKGAALFVLGIAAIWVPLQFVVAAFLVANGTRMVWLEACRVNKEEGEDGLYQEARHAGVGRNSQHRLEQADAGSFYDHGQGRGQSPALGAPKATQGVPARVEKLKEHPEGVWL